MILIISEEQDFSTDKFLEWLVFYKIPFVRINKEENLNALTSFDYSYMNDVDFVLSGKAGDVKFKEIQGVWFRRGYLNFKVDFREEKRLNLQNKKIKDHLKLESKTLVKFIYSKLKEKRHLNSPLHYNSNKLQALDCARKVGLKVPVTMITNQKSVLQDFYKSYESIITKNIQDSLFLTLNGIEMGQSPRLIDADLINQLSERFSYSLFQENIPKKYELRIFYLNKKCYSAATFPLENELDGSGNTNRIVPFHLPPKIEEQIVNFMTLMALNSGSIDMIVTPTLQFVFLEVNPVGQFNYVSQLCNYDLEKEIVKYFDYETVIR